MQNFKGTRTDSPSTIIWHQSPSYYWPQLQARTYSHGTIHRFSPNFLSNLLVLFLKFQPLGLSQVVSPLQIHHSFPHSYKFPGWELGLHPLPESRSLCSSPFLSGSRHCPILVQAQQLTPSSLCLVLLPSIPGQPLPCPPPSSISWWASHLPQLHLPLPLMVWFGLRFQYQRGPWIHPLSSKRMPQAPLNSLTPCFQVLVQVQVGVLSLSQISPSLPQGIWTQRSLRALPPRLLWHPVGGSVGCPNPPNLFLFKFSFRLFSSLWTFFHTDVTVWSWLWGDKY